MSHLSPKGIQNIKRGLRRSWESGGPHDLRFRHHEVDADTLRSRTRYDRKGTFYADIRTAAGEFKVLWSTAGRTDQLDVFHRGKLLTTCRPNRVLKRIGELSK